MNLKFDLQFFGSGGSSTQRIQKRAPQPTELNTLVHGLYNKLYPSIETFNADGIKNAQNLSNNAIQQQGNLLSQVPRSMNRSNDIINKMLNVTETGEIPLGLANNMNSIVNKELSNSMGNMLNGLSNRGVLNSSITGQGISRLGEQAADAYNKNYLTAYNAVLNGYGQALQGAQNNTNQLSGLINSLGSMPSMAYDNAYAGLMPAFNFWKTWQTLENSKPEEYDTVVQQGK